MSLLRPECSTSSKEKLPDQVVLRRVYDAVRKRRTLAYGKLDAADGHCAMGCFWDDNPGTVVATKVLDQVAAVNDSVPPTATRSERRKHVMRWLEWKLGINQ